MLPSERFTTSKSRPGLSNASRVAHCAHRAWETSIKCGHMLMHASGFLMSISTGCGLWLSQGASSTLGWCFRSLTTTRRRLRVFRFRANPRSRRLRGRNRVALAADRHAEGGCVGNTNRLYPFPALGSAWTRRRKSSRMFFSRTLVRTRLSGLWLFRTAMD